jgi:uncharacterized protein involved in exopolysaccharide biosynthesis
MPFFMPPKYKSIVVFYPSTTNSISKALLNENNYDKSDPLQFGEEEEAEQLIQILYSDDIRDRIIQKYDLMQHYKIAADDDYKFTKLYEEYADNISFRRTEYMSVEIKVLDTDPKIAANIANDIAAMLDETKNAIQRKNATEALSIVQAEYNRKGTLVQTLNDSLNVLRSVGVFDYEQQAGKLTEEYIDATTGVVQESSKLGVYRQSNMTETDTLIIRTRARIKGFQESSKNLKQELNILSKYGGAYTSISEQLTLENEELSKLRERYNRSKVDVEKVLPVKFVVNQARIAEKKSYPIRWLICALSTLGALLAAVLGLVVYENYQHIKQKK